MDDPFEDLFAEAKAEGDGLVTDDFLARVLAEAEALQPAMPSAAPPLQSRSLMQVIFDTIGGWQGTGGLVAATMASVWIGFSGADVLSLEDLQTFVSGDTEFYLSDLGGDFSFDFGEGYPMSDQTPQSPKEQPPRAPMRRSLRILLFLSLAANLVIVGLVAGAMMGKQKGGKPPRDADFMGAYTRALPQEDRRAIGRAIREHHRLSGITRQVARQKFQQMLTILRATPFDEAAMQEQMAAQAKAAFDRREAAQQFWLERIAAMSDAERQDYADQIEAQLKRGPRGEERRKK